ncbi:MAG: PAS domain-containing protein [Methyloligellaceae bacterium]
MQQKTSQLLYNYWDQIRNGRLAPRRFEIEPAKIASILPETFILECGGPLGYRFRLAGTRLCEQFGREFRGLCLLDGWSAEDREALETLLHNVVTDGAAGLAAFAATTEDDRTAEFEMLVLPLIHAGSTVNRLLGSITAIDTPYWLGAVPLTQQKITSVQLIWPDSQPRCLSEPVPEPALVTPLPRTVGDMRRRFRVYEGGLSDSSD